jgi:hypothetical protein
MSNKFENCTGRATDKKPAAKAAGFVFSAAGKARFPKRTKKQNGTDEVGTGFLG